MTMHDPRTCEHDNYEQLTDEVAWCPDCGSRWAATREEIQRVQELFMQKLAERHPNHPWVQLDIRK